MHDEQEDGSMKYKGYCIDLMNELQKLLHFSYEIYEVPDGKYGGLTDNGTWNGMVGELVRGVCEVAFLSWLICNVVWFRDRIGKKKEIEWCRKGVFFAKPSLYFLVPVVHNLDSPNRWINLCPVDSAIGFSNTYPLDSEYLVNSAIQRLNNLALVFSSLYIPSLNLSSINFVS